ncbi:hypothetical protein ADK41_16905 [Streptomyces caelestis]|uniref:Uncharacterized protein n=1 Tax=Streptomyces caelestis TaxID=36816 RepID=A0A0M8QJ75_9ACTN|nr:MULTISPECIES: hypothetical protein [Streptomyces]KOT38087.1 hypothetical protein ADK41_16905 [Streptomyces caelestis]KOV22359.1 hypothetical protein ADK58_27515 [Streptomyces sp. XY152]
MATGSADSPATLYGPVSLVLGTAASVTVVFAGLLGIAFSLLFGSLAVTFALLGLRQKLNRVQCGIGLATGSLGVLHPVLLVSA